MWCGVAQGEGSRCCEKMAFSPDLLDPAGFRPHDSIPFSSGSHPGPSMLTASRGQTGTEPKFMNLVQFLFLK